MHELSVVSQVKEELESRYLQLHKRLTSLRAESEEVWKTLETAESTLMEMISAKDYDVSPLFAAAAAAAAAGQEDEKNFLLTVAPFNRQPEAALTKLRSDRQETEDFYLNVSTSGYHETPLKTESSQLMCHWCAFSEIPRVRNGI